VIKDAAERDKLSAELGGVLCLALRDRIDPILLHPMHAPYVRVSDLRSGVSSRC
jgi:hypothetical protein